MKSNLLTFAAFGALTVGAYAATTGTIDLQGTVAPKAEIFVDQTGANNTGLPLDQDVTDRSVATVTEKCNSTKGYTVTLSFKNAIQDGYACLKGTATGEVVKYSVKYRKAGSTDPDVTILAASGGSNPTGTKVSDETSKTSSTGNVKYLSISYTVTGEFLAADTYTDQMTLTIAAK